MKSALSATALPAPGSRAWLFALAFLTMLAIPFAAHAQGIIGGAEEGVRRGNRAAGPVGAVVGGAVGAGVGGVVGGVRGVVGAPRSHRHRHYRRRHYHRRHY